MVKVTIHHAAHPPDDAQRLAVNLLLEKIDATVVDGPISTVPESHAKIVSPAISIGTSDRRGSTSND